MYKPFLFVFLLFVLLLESPANGQAQAFALPELLPQELEVDLALSALPSHLRAEAGVYVLVRGGYQSIRKETNGFTCLVRRMGAVPGTFSDAILPVCYDREGTATLLPAVLDEVMLLEQGHRPEEVAATIEKRWADGTYTVPGPGVSYMLSPIFRLNGRDGGYVPHLMFHGPYKTGADVGASDDRYDYVPFVQAAGRPSAMIVVPVGVQERAAIMDAEQDLIAKVQAYLAQ